MDEGARQRAVARAGLEWVFTQLRYDSFRGAREIGPTSVLLFLEVALFVEAGGLQETAPDRELAAFARGWALACLGALEASLEASEPPPPWAACFEEMLRLVWCRSELRPGADAALPPRSARRAAETGVAGRGAWEGEGRSPSVGSTARADALPAGGSARCALQRLRDAQTRELLKCILPEEACRLRLDSRAGFAAEPGLRAAGRGGLQEALRGLRGVALAWPGSRPAKDLAGAFGEDLDVVAGLQDVLTCCGAARSASGAAPWLCEYAREALPILMSSCELGTFERVAVAAWVLACGDGAGEASAATLEGGREWLSRQAAAEGRIGPPAAATGDLLSRIRPTWLAARALAHRGPGQGAARYEEFAQYVATCLDEAGLARAALAEIAPPLECYLGIPDGRPGGQVPVVKASSIGGAGGRGLFTEKAGPPVPLELLRDTRFGLDGFISNEESERMWEEDLEGKDFIVLLVLGPWFRDEYTSGPLFGSLRPLAAVLPRWMEEGRCIQSFSWDEEQGEYALEGGRRSAYVAADSESNLAAMANDALFNSCDTEEEYNLKDRQANNLVMVPCARPVWYNKDKVEFASVWLYPRWGWCWDDPQELTLGYGWEKPD